MGAYKLVLIAAGLLAVAFLIRLVVLRARSLTGRIEEYHREQEAEEKLREQGLIGPANPFADLVELFRNREEDRRR